MKRFLCAAFFIALVALLAACGMLNRAGSAAQATATPTNSTSRTQENEPVTVHETSAKVDVVTAQSSQTPSSTAAPEQQVSTPATGDFPVLYLAGIVGLILICSAGLLMLRKI